MGLYEATKDDLEMNLPLFVIVVKLMLSSERWRGPSEKLDDETR